jgi:phenylalanyl-tRNA synthetase beta chain
MRVEPLRGEWRITPPSFRFDVAIEEDLIEEVGRMIGYDRIPSTPGTNAERLGHASEKMIAPDRLADLLVARGYTEAVTYSFVAPELDAAVCPGSAAVELVNPIARDLAVLRRSLWPGLMAAARLNLSHQRQRLKLFELGPRFSLSDGAVTQATVLAGLALGARRAEHWDEPAAELDFFDVKGDVESLFRLTGRAGELRFTAATHPALCPGRTASVSLGARAIGWLGSLHPDLQRVVDKKRPIIVFELEIDNTFTAAIPVFRNYSKFPAIRRDLAIVVDEQVTADQLKDVARGATGDLLRHVAVFDVYRGKGVDSRRKSVGLGLILQDVSRTLTDDDADKTMRSVILALERALGATIRT